MKICVIGLGEIGSTVMKAIKEAKTDDELYGLDIDNKILEQRKKEGFNVGKMYSSEHDVYIVSVWTTDQVFKVMSCIDRSNNPLIVIESTINPGTMKELKKKYTNVDIVCFPHRYFKDDPNYDVFNLKRVMGATNEKAIKRALEFYTKYMDKDLIHVTDMEIAELCKPLENSIRYVDIAFAEEVRMLCEERNISFKKLREAVNTKWNIELKEARDGISRHCLPKDIEIIMDVFDNSLFFECAKKTDMIYKAMVREWKKKQK